MKNDIVLINLNDLDVDKLELPHEGYNANFICNGTVPDNELLLKVINGTVKEINICGKYAVVWESCIDNICAEQENDDQRSSNWSVATNNLNLDSLINSLFFAYKEFYDGEVSKHNPILLFYDDEDLKNFIIKRVNYFLEDTSREDECEDNEYCDIDKEIRSKERIELNAHTNKTKCTGIDGAFEMIRIANTCLRCGGMAITDRLSTQSLVEAYKFGANKKNFKLIYGVETILLENDLFYPVLFRNKDGKNAIYKILTEIFTKYPKLANFNEESRENINKMHIQRNLKIQNILKENRDNILIGSPENGNWLVGTFICDPDKLANEIAKYDYIQVKPLENYWFTSGTEENLGEEITKKAIREIIKEAKKQNKLVVATSSPYYGHERQYLAFSILNKDNVFLGENYDGHLYSTEEMRYAFDWLNDDDLVEEIVVTNTHKIADMCEDFEFIDETYHVPSDEFGGNYVTLTVRTALRLQSLYGPNIDPLIEERYQEELRIIRENDYASIYMLATEVIDEIKAEGYICTVRGSIGATLIGYLLGISKSNPLPPHYVCPNCHKVIWIKEAESGFDLPTKLCDECKTQMKADGHNIPYESFMGINGEKKPNIDINIASQYRDKILDIIKKVAPNNTIYRAGLISTIPYQDAMKMINDFAGEGEEVLDNDTKQDLLCKFKNVSNKQAVCLESFIIVPNEVDINEYTPLTSIDGVVCNHNEYNDLSDSFYKADFLAHVDPDNFKYFIDNDIDFSEVNINDPKIMNLFDDNNNLDFIGIPEFGRNTNTINLIEKVKPKTFSDLVKIYSLMLGIGTWNNNYDKLFEQGIPLKELLGCSDDVFNKLTEYGISKNNAYEIMKRVSKGDGLTTKQEELIKKHNLPDWFIDSCNTIKYMVSKAHAIEYVINSLVYAWMKIYKPSLFYANLLNKGKDLFKLNYLFEPINEIEDRINKICSKETTNVLDKIKLISLKIIKEMTNRGIKVINVDVTDDSIKREFVVNPDNELEILCRLVKEEDN